MTVDQSPRATAARIRGILGGQDRGNIEATARRLGVSEAALRAAVNERDPHLTLDVLHAIVINHGVDPTWLITGEYDAATHRAVIEDGRAITRGELAQLIASRVHDDGVSRFVAPELRLEA